MRDRKKSTGNSKRPKHEKPFYVVVFAAFLRVFFILYDAIVYIPFRIFANPEKKLELSKRVKARNVVEGDPSSPWRHVDTIGKELYFEMFPGCDCLGKLWDESVRLHGDAYCIGSRKVLEVHEEKHQNHRSFHKLVLGEYEWKNYTEIDRYVAKVFNGLLALGLKKGDHVVIYAETRMEWLVSAIACFKSGLTVVTVYPTLGEEAIAHALRECDAVAVFTTKGLLQKVAAAIKDCSSFKQVIYYAELHQHPDESSVASEKVQEMFTKIGCRIHSFDLLTNVGSNEVTKVKVNPDNLAMIMYTSGTTGNPKGVLLSHRNIIAALTGQSAVIPVGEGDTYIGYLPLAHILEVCAELVVLYKGCRIGYSSAQTLFDRAPNIKHGSKGDCIALKPTLMACVPAIMDRIYKAVSDEVKKKSAFQRELFRVCYERKRARYEEGYSSLVMNKIAFDRIRKLLGGELRVVLSGGAPLNPETQRFMNICFCCPVVQGYGLTETCGGATLADVHDLSTGAVGPPLRCCEIMLRPWLKGGYSPKNKFPQGEILIHGANVALGYYKNEEKTNEDFIRLNGKRWFASGDIGEFRADGSICIIDRKKDLIKLAHGEYISLGRVETNLLTNPHVDNICVYGHADFNHLIALMVPNQKNLEALAEKNGVSGKTLEELCHDPTVLKALARELHDHASGKLTKSEIPQRLILCPEPWTPASGLLTEALKLKRKAIEKQFKEEINKVMKK